MSSECDWSAFSQSRADAPVISRSFFASSRRAFSGSTRFESPLASAPAALAAAAAAATAEPSGPASSAFAPFAAGSAAAAGGASAGGGWTQVNGSMLPERPSAAS